VGSATALPTTTPFDRRVGRAAGRTPVAAFARSAFQLTPAIPAALAAPNIALAQVRLLAVNLGQANFEDGFASRGWFAQRREQS